MTLVVLKFGGTSLANTKLMSNAVEKVLNEISLGNKVIVVVSAMAGVTDHLVSLTHEISDCASADNAAEYANVITSGEQISAGLFTLLLQQAGVKARSWLGWQAGIITDNALSNGNIIDLKYDSLNESLNRYQVAVVTGFQGVTKDRRVSSLGRGGSDTTAIILAGALKAKRCDIYTDVEGVFTADPRVVAKAQKLDSINYDQMIAFAHAGAKILQAKSVKWAKHYQVPVQVLSSFTSNPGTLVSNIETICPIAGIALSQEENLAKISIIGTNIENNSTLEAKLKEKLLKKNIEIFSLSSATMILSFLIKEENKFDAMRLLHTACKLD